MSKIDVSNMDLYYGDFHALKNINLSIDANEVTAFIGPSGCGKSTLLKSINRMNDLVPGCRITGEMLLDGENIYGGKMDVNGLRKRVGMVFQKPNPFPMSIYDNIAYGPRTHGVRSKAKLDDIVEQSLRQAAIWDEVKDRLKKSALGMSGGQQQRLCIARALAGGSSDGRTNLSTGSDFYFQNRRSCGRIEKRLYYCHGNPQYAAGSQNFRQNRIFPVRRGSRIRRDRTDLLHAEG